jgi:hypothetical protein
MFTVAWFALAGMCISDCSGLHAGNVNEAVAANAHAELSLSFDGGSEAPSDVKLTYSVGTDGGVMEISELTICGAKPMLASQTAGLPIFQHIHDGIVHGTLAVQSQIAMPVAPVKLKLNIKVNSLRTVG